MALIIKSLFMAFTMAWLLLLILLAYSGEILEAIVSVVLGGMFVITTLSVINRVEK